MQQTAALAIANRMFDEDRANKADIPVITQILMAWDDTDLVQLRRLCEQHAGQYSWKAQCRVPKVVHLKPYLLLWQP
jgi:hypothetical protein